MKKSKLFRTLTLAAAAALCMATTTVTAYAGGADPDPVPLPETTEAPAEVPEETEEPTTDGMEPEGVPVTPQGNAALVDDFFGDKQLITVTTKAGNYFYILIDRANEDKETAVHFLNQVDDADLQALLEDGKKEPEVCTCTAKCQAGAVNTACPVCKNNLTACNGPEPKPQPEEEKPQEEKPSGMGGLVVFFVVVLLGGGEPAYIEKMQALAQELALGDSVIFAGVRSNIQSFYDAMDAFMLPSLFEGLPVVLVEAQTAGLPCFVSDTVDPGAAFTDRVRFLPLQDTGAWADAIAAASFRRDPQAREKAVRAGYDIHTSAAVLQEFYLRRYAEVTK